MELKRDAVSYIIEFVYRGEVNIPGERLTDVCQVEILSSVSFFGLRRPLVLPSVRPSVCAKNLDHLYTGIYVDKAPRLSISIVIFILSSDTICQLNQFNTNSETAMLSTLLLRMTDLHMRILLKV